MPEVRDAAPKTDANGDWLDDNMHMDHSCWICGREHKRRMWVGGYIYGNDGKDGSPGIKRILDEDDTLPPAVRKGLVCLTCLVLVKGRKTAKKQHPSIGDNWHRSGWTWGVTIKKLIANIRHAFWPFEIHSLRTYSEFKIPRRVFYFLFPFSSVALVQCLCQNAICMLR